VETYSTQNNKSLWVQEREWKNFEDANDLAFSNLDRPSRSNQQWRLSLQEYFRIQVSLCIVAHSTHCVQLPVSLNLPRYYTVREVI